MMRRIYCVAAALVLAACSTPADVRTALAPDAQIERFRTFAFVQGDVRGPGAITDKLARERLQYNIAVHLGGRGYTPAAPGQAADLGVHYYAQVQTAQRDLMTGYPGLYENRDGSVEVGGYKEQEYRQGTLIIDLFDRAKKQLLWRARISGAFSAGYSEENWKKVDRALGEAFKDLPKPR